MKLVIFIGISIFIAISAVAHTKNGKSNLLRVCYYTLNNPVPSKLNVSLCTHIIAGFCSVKNGMLDLGSQSRKDLYLETTHLKSRNPDLKVLLTVGGGGNVAGFSEAFNSTWNRTRFIISSFVLLEKYNFDGLDIDWEFPVWNDNLKSDKQNLIFFLKEFKLLAKSFASSVSKRLSRLLTVAVAAPKNIIDSAYDIPQMAEYVDFINLMAYDYHDYYWYTPFTGHNSPLFNRSVEKGYFATLNTAWSAYYWYQQGMPKSKIMVGIPTYGHSYKLIDPKMNAVDAPASGTQGDVTFSQVCDFISSGAIRVFDNESRVPYAYKGYDWISYEDSVSIYGKAKWILSEGFGGFMTFDLNADDWSCVCDKTPYLLHRIIYNVFRSGR